MTRIRLRIGEIFLLGLLLCSLALSIYYYTERPPGFNPRSGLLATFGISFLMLGVLTVYLSIPRFRARPPDVRFRYYDRLMIWVFAFWLLGQFAEFSKASAKFSYEHMFMATKVFGMTVIGVLFYLLGDTFAHAKPGWFVALPYRRRMRHPKVWELTHANLGKWLKRAGLMCLPAILLPFKWPFYASLYLVGACIVVAYYYCFIYPSRLYKRLDKTAGPETRSVPP